jgi:chemotaxis protein histidine kinase CheA
MEINFNLGSLKIVHPPLMDYFKKIQSNVSANLILIRDEKKVATNYEAIELLTKAQGTLKMIGLVGLVNVLQLCTESLKDVKEVKFDTAKNIKVLEACEGIFKNVALYLEILLIGELDQPTKFYTEYAALASLVGKTVSIKDLFTPKLDMKEGTPGTLQADLRLGLAINESSKESILSTLKKAHSLVAQHTASISFMLDKSNLFSSTDDKNTYHNYCKEIYEVLTDVQNLKISKHVYVLTGLQKLFVCVTSPIFNDEVSKIMTLGGSVLNVNFSNIEKSLATWISTIESLEEGDRTGVVKADDDTTKEVLYFLIQVLNDNKKLKDMPVFVELATYFDFDFYNSQLTNTQIVSTVMQKNNEIGAQIDKLFLDVKEELTLITSKQSNSEDFLVQHTTKFISFNQKLNEALVSTDTKELSGILNALNAVFTKIKNKELKFLEALQKEVSLAVVLVEYGINTFIKSVVTAEDRSNFAAQVSLQQKRLLLAATGKLDDLAKLALPELDEKSKKSDERKAFLKIFQELSKEFLKAEAVLDQFLRNQEDGLDEIKEVFKSLKSARGIFAVIGKPELSKIVVEIIKVWEKILESGIDAVEKDLLNNSIAWLSGISLIISASKDDNEVEANEVMANLLPKFNAYFKIESPVETVVNVVPTPVVVAPTPVMEVTNVVADVVTSTEVKKEVAAGLYEDTPNDPDLTEIYLMEADEVLENMAVSLKAVHSNMSDSEELTNIRRYFHTLKGSGKMVGLKYLGEAGWIVEQTLNKILSGDIKLTEALFEVIKFSEAQFHHWVNELKAHNVVGVDLIAFKQQFNPHNPHLTTTFEIPDHAEVVAPIVVTKVVEEVMAVKPEVVEAPKDVLLVGDKEITIMLYNMFVEESTNHMKSMSQFVHNPENQNGSTISSDFMLHAHTLASIARTVNLLDCAKIASKIELIANLALEKNLTINAEEMKTLGHAVDNLEKFRSVANGVQIDQEYVNSLISNLSELQESISNRNSVPKEVEQMNKNVMAFDMDELVAKLTLVMGNKAPVAATPAFDMDELVSKLAAVMERKAPAVEQAPALDMNALVEAVSAKLSPMLKNQSAPAMDMKALADSVSSTLKASLEDGVAKINSTLKHALENSVAQINTGLKASVEENTAKVQKIHNEFQAILEANSNNVSQANAGFMTQLASNVQEVEKMNAQLKSSVENNVNHIQTELSELVAKNIADINSQLKSALEHSLGEINTSVVSALTETVNNATASISSGLKDSVESIATGLTHTVSSNVNSMNEVVNDLKEELENVKAVKTQVIDSEKMTTDIMSQVQESIQKQYGEVTKVLSENKYNTKEVVNELFNKIDTIEASVKEIGEGQKASEQEVQDAISTIKADIRSLNDTIHNAASTKGGFLKGLFGK